MDATLPPSSEAIGRQAPRLAPLILVVEDEPLLQGLVTAILGDIHGFDVEIAGSGEQAKTLLLGPVPDAVLLDVLLPDCTGWDVLAALRASRATRHVPVIVSTASSESMPPLGAHVSTLPKPYPAAALVATMQAALASA